MIYEGSRSQIGLASLSPLAEDVASPKLFEAGHRQFQFRAADSKRPLAWAILKAFPAALFAPLLPCIICCELPPLAVDIRRADALPRQLSRQWLARFS